MKKALSCFLALCMAVSLCACGGKTTSSAETKETLETSGGDKQSGPKPISQNDPHYQEKFEAMQEIEAYYENVEGSDFVKGYLSDLTCISHEYSSEQEDYVAEPLDVVMTFSETEVTINGKSYSFEEIRGIPNGDEWEYIFGNRVEEKEKDGSTIRRLEAICRVGIALAKDTPSMNYSGIDWTGDLAIAVSLEEELKEELNLPVNFTAFPSRFGTVATAKKETTNPADTGLFETITLGSYKGQDLEWLVVAQSGSTKTLMCLQAVDWVDMGNTTGTYEDTNIFAFVNGGFLAGFDAAGAKVTSVTLASPEELAKVDAPVFETLLMLPEEDYSAGKKYWTTVFSDDVNRGFGNNSMAFFDKYGGDGGGSDDICGLVPLITVEY